MKTRRHHNNDGRSQIQRGKTHAQIAAMARRLGVPVKKTRHAIEAIGLSEEQATLASKGSDQMADTRQRFPLGARVQMTAVAFKNRLSGTRHGPPVYGTVRGHGRRGQVRVQRDGLKTVCSYHGDFWEATGGLDG